MYERSYGSKYQEFFTDAEGKSVWRTAAEIAKAIRTDIKAAVTAGDLPKATYSVTCDNFAGGRSIDVTAYDVEGAYRPATQQDVDVSWNNRLKVGDDIMTEHGTQVQERLQSIHGAYNHDGSDLMTDYFDVNFYGQAKVADSWSQQWHDTCRAEAKAKREAKKAATV